MKWCHGRMGKSWYCQMCDGHKKKLCGHLLMCDGLTLGEFRDNLSVLLSWNTKTTNRYICFKLNRGNHAKKKTANTFTMSQGW